jgi:hypothetical protein
MSQFRRRPQTPDQFLEEAEEVSMVAKEDTAKADMPNVTMEELPWNSPHMDDITKTFQLRLKMKHLLMLRYIAENTPHNVSMQKFCMDILIPAIEKRVMELKKG